MQNWLGMHKTARPGVHTGDWKAGLAEGAFALRRNVHPDDYKPSGLLGSIAFQKLPEIHTNVICDLTSKPAASWTSEVTWIQEVHLWLSMVLVPLGHTWLRILRPTLLNRVFSRRHALVSYSSHFFFLNYITDFHLTLQCSMARTFFSQFIELKMEPVEYELYQE